MADGRGCLAGPVNDDEAMARHHHCQLSPPVTFAADVLDVAALNVTCAARDAAPASCQVAEGAQKSAIAAEPAGRWVGLRQAALAVLDAWDGYASSDGNIIGALVAPIAGLRSALATAASSRSAPTDRPRAPKDTKQARVLATLRHNEGASGPQIAEAMGWALHTVRGFLAGLAKKGIKIDVLERVRQIGPNGAGAKGSYTVYRVAGVTRP